MSSSRRKNHPVGSGRRGRGRRHVWGPGHPTAVLRLRPAARPVRPVSRPQCLEVAASRRLAARSGISATRRRLDLNPFEAGTSVTPWHEDSVCWQRFVSRTVRAVRGLLSHGWPGFVRVWNLVMICTRLASYGVAVFRDNWSGANVVGNFMSWREFCVVLTFVMEPRLSTMPQNCISKCVVHLPARC